MWSIFPDSAIFPSKSNNLLVFFLIHLSIKQFPGPTSLLKIFKSLSISVMFAIPPIFNMETGIFTLFSFNCFLSVSFFFWCSLIFAKSLFLILFGLKDGLILEFFFLEDFFFFEPEILRKSGLTWIVFLTLIINLYTK